MYIGGVLGVTATVLGNGHRSSEFKPWTRWFAFHKALIPLKKV